MAGVQIEYVSGVEPWLELKRANQPARFCLVTLPGSVHGGGVSPFDSRIESERLTVSLRTLADTAAGRLAAGGVLCLYGAPEWVTLALAQCPRSFALRHWIAVACRPRANGWLARSHRALALLTAHGSAVRLRPTRAPHRACRACGQALRDWGGRRPRMHREGVRLSDVWSDLDLDLDDAVPAALVERLANLTGAGAGDGALIVVPTALGMPPTRHASAPLAPPATGPATGPLLRRATQSDCLELLRGLPADSIDLAFADPPYNLAKAYTSSGDYRAPGEYLGWCHAWLTEYARVVRPRGTLAVLTLPLWAAAHAGFLMRHRALRFDRWIIWDALGEPKGPGLLPAHYALILFTKGHPHRPPTLPHLGTSIPDLCRRAGCVAARAPTPRAPLTDVWRDIPRLRHARFRDAHPCQLPHALLERLVSIASPPGGIVLDAFCGTGTTGAAALACARRPILADISPEYVAISSGKLAARRGV
jgi:site-specific DNA-methyltransferase (adenine-specific)